MDYAVARRRKSDRMREALLFAYRVLGALVVVLLLLYALVDSALVLHGSDRIHAQVQKVRDK